MAMLHRLHVSQNKLYHSAQTVDESKTKDDLHRLSCVWETAQFGDCKLLQSAINNHSQVVER